MLRRKAPAAAPVPLARCPQLCIGRTASMPGLPRLEPARVSASQLGRDLGEFGGSRYERFLRQRSDPTSQASSACVYASRAAGVAPLMSSRAAGAASFCSTVDFSVEASSPRSEDTKAWSSASTMSPHIVEQRRAPSLGPLPAKAYTDKYVPGRVLLREALSRQVAPQSEGAAPSPVALDEEVVEVSEVDEFSEVLMEPRIGTPACPSVGSAGHNVGLCKPCDFLHRNRCQNGAACKFCHICGPDESKIRKKRRQGLARAARRFEKNLAVAGAELSVALKAM